MNSDATCTNFSIPTVDQKGQRTYKKRLIYSSYLVNHEQTNQAVNSSDPKCRPTWSIYLLTSKAGCFSKIVMVPIGQMLVDQKGHQMKMVAYMVNVKLTKKAK